VALPEEAFVLLVDEDESGRVVELAQERLDLDTLLRRYPPARRRDLADGAARVLALLDDRRRRAQVRRLMARAATSGP
jgi:hypothetical protein